LQLLWPVLVLVHLPTILNTIAVVVYRRIAHTHDWEHADDLPQTAGDWLRDRAAVLGLRVLVTDQNQSDAFHYDRRVIHLSPETHFKSDAVFWAIAAHELGHARTYSELPLIAAFSRVAMWMKHLFLYVGTGLAIGNVLYMRPRGLDLAFALLAGSLVLRALEAIEEAYASYLAHGELRATGRLTPERLRVVRRVLLAALGTYVSTVIGGAILLSQWSIVERIAGDGWLGELGALTTLGWIVVIALCVLGLGYAYLNVARIKGLTETRNLFGLVWRLLSVILIALVWDLSGTTTWAWCVILAVISAQRVVVALLMMPGSIPVMAFASVVRKLSGPGHHPSNEYAASHAAGKPLISDGNRALREIFENRAQNPTPQSRLFDLIALFYLPLIVAIGGGLIT